MSPPINPTAGRCARPRCSRPARVDLCDRHKDRLYKLRKARGEYDLVDATAARRHLLFARSRGYTWLNLEAMVHMRRDRVVAVGRGTLTEIPVHQERSVLAARFEWQRTRVSVPLAGTQRRMDALAWQGWSRIHYGSLIGVSESTLGVAAWGNRVTAATAAAIAEFYDHNAHLLGPDPRVAAAARRRGALPWAAWDDDTIDDPAAKPLPTRLWRRESDAPVRRIYAEEILGLLEGGRSLERIAIETGFTLKSLQDALAVHRGTRAQHRAQRREDTTRTESAA